MPPLGFRKLDLRELFLEEARIPAPTDMPNSFTCDSEVGFMTATLDNATTSKFFSRSEGREQ
jgi:hypothetical protein